MSEHCLTLLRTRGHAFTARSLASCKGRQPRGLLSSGADSYSLSHRLAILTVLPVVHMPCLQLLSHSRREGWRRAAR